MTDIEVEKIHAQISQMIAETAKAQAEAQRMADESPVSNEKTLAQIRLINLEASKAQAEANKIKKDLKWYEIILLISATVAFTALIAVLTKVFL